MVAALEPTPAPAAPSASLPAAALPPSGRSEALRPPLKWAGGKRWLVPHLAPTWRAHAGRRLVEPFCGGLAVATQLRPARALLNDINPHAINLYTWIARGLSVRIPVENSREVYDRHRERFNALVREDRADSDEAAQLFYYLNRTGFNGLCRFNSRGEFNVPFGRYARIGYLQDFGHLQEAFAGWEFTCGDFARLQLEPGDFVYADPPYDVPFTKYSKEDFRWADQERLARWLARHPGPVVASNQATDRVLALYRELGFQVKTLPAPRHISCTGDRSPALEMLATRNL